MPTWYPPSECRKATPQHRALKPGTLLSRIYAREPHDDRADSFRTFGPIYRFDHHRYPAEAPALDADRGVLYVSESTAGCLLEVFYGLGTVTRHNGEGGAYRLATLEITRPLLLLKLDGEDAAIDAGTTGNIFTEPHDETQPWARHFYDDTNVYQKVDGISYQASHGGQVAVALFERAKDKLVVAEDNAFTEPATRSIITQLAHRYRLERHGI